MEYLEYAYADLWLIRTIICLIEFFLLNTALAREQISAAMKPNL